ncbi:MAG TPA: hypothetical protein VNT75_07345, partial [Symbiobacteriaceae bacterium]|nr:hypothetical protein [Symbiobacteriaceae bacterium]
MRRWVAAGLAGGLLGLGLALLGDAVTVYRGLWVYIGLVPGVLGALWFGPGAGLVAGLLIGAAGGSPFVALAVGLWMALVGWLGARRWPGLT